MHYGWFQCIYAYGWVGLIMKLICFGNIAILYGRRAFYGSKAAKVGLGVFVMCMFVYFFIQTSFLESITGGVLFGMAIGYSLSISNMEAASNIGSTQTHTLHQSFARPSYYLKD
jgi:MFS family permease